MKYAELRKINVNEHVEKKNGLSYLSWAWAVDKLMELDETAYWEYETPEEWSGTWIVRCKVVAFGKSRTAHLPVMDYKNKAVTNPDAFAVNTAMQRCLAKAIALHGIGLYIYAGEDIPPDAAEVVSDNIVAANVKPTSVPEPANASQLVGMATLIKEWYAQENLEEIQSILELVQEPEEKIYLWNQLDSKIRSFIKKGAKNGVSA
jgi:hypothetical protein